ncbi:MAG TPA: glycoside hydrolase family 3 N-terminal domain-containing protein [Polyangiaceae bacterium]|nr:glycoside hydrolase family 3 N-terminal domain-containing protein [Polyangiaceae bacterium]
MGFPTRTLALFLPSATALGVHAGCGAAAQPEPVVPSAPASDAAAPSRREAPSGAAREGGGAGSAVPAVPARGDYHDARLPVDARVADLLSRMTLDEKIAQLESANWDHTRLDDSATHAFSRQQAVRWLSHGIGAVTRPGDRHDVRGAVEFVNAIQKYLVGETRLGIPALVHEEALHGLVAPGATSFPQAIALAATFDPKLVQDVFSVAARQARDRGVNHVLAPVLDVARDPRWGRFEETYGEDPYLVSRVGVAAVRGLQGRRSGDEPIDARHVMATAKHFAAHGTPEGGRNTAPGNVSAHVLREVFLAPFEAAVREAGVGSVMASYNELDGVPSHANRWLLQDVLRGEWGYSGLVVSDYFGVAELERKHHVVADLRAAARRAIDAGVEVEFPEAEAYATLAEQVQDGSVPVADIDRAAAHVLRAKFLLGLFENPFADAEPKAELPSDRDMARRAAEEALVLLKNDGLLPLDAARVKSMAIIGPNASVCRLGGYSGRPDHAVSVLEGVTARAGSRIKILSAPGCGLTRGNRGWSDDLVELSDPEEDRKAIAIAAKLSAAADVTLMVLGQDEQLSREAWADSHRGDRMTLDLVGRQMDLANAVFATGHPTVVLLVHGSPLAVPELARRASALIDGFYLGEETGTALAGVLFGDVSPSGRLPVSIPRSVGQLPVYYDYKPSARRPYLFEEPGPLWPFGFGLGYAAVLYDAPTVTPPRIPPDGRAVVGIKVTNAGARATDEVVQLYIHDLVSSVTRPVQELKGFRRIHLEAGESKHVEITVGPEELSLLDERLHRVVEPGAFDVMVGGSSADVKTARLEVVATMEHGRSP